MSFLHHENTLAIIAVWGEYMKNKLNKLKTILLMISIIPYVWMAITLITYLPGIIIIVVGLGEILDIPDSQMIHELVLALAYQYALIITPCVIYQSYYLITEGHSKRINKLKHILYKLSIIVLSISLITAPILLKDLDILQMGVIVSSIIITSLAYIIMYKLKEHEHLNITQDKRRT